MSFNHPLPPSGRSASRRLEAEAGVAARRQELPLALLQLPDGTAVRERPRQGRAALLNSIAYLLAGPSLDYG